MESWDDDNFEPQVIAPTTVTSNKWEGEDEDENIKESWEDEDEESKPKEEKPSEPAKVKPKKRIQEKEKKKREEYERRLKEQDEEEEEEISPEEKLKRQQESDLKLALETTFGDTKDKEVDSSGLNFNASTKEEFDELVESLSKKLQPLSKSTEYYPAFAEDLIRDLCVTLTSFDIKKIKTTIDNLYLEKQKIEKGEKTRKTKGKAKAKIKVEDANQYSAYVDNFDDYDDFM